MTVEYSLQFNEGEPLDATKLQKLVEFINEVNAKALKVPSGSDIAGDVVAAVMTTGVSENIPIAASTGTAQEVSVKFNKPLSNTPYSVIVTLECPSNDMDLVHYVKSYDRNGFTLMVNRIAGVDKDNKVYTASRTFNVKAHYFAIAQPSLG